MLTFTMAYTRAAQFTGVSTTNTADITFLKQDINQGERLLKNAARRYWTRQEKITNLVANQQYYQLAPDMVRVTEVRVNSNGLNFPTILVNSEHLWNKLNIIPAMTINLPTYSFIRGSGEIGLWPTPAANTTNGLIISYEPRMVDMTQDDVTAGTASVTNGSTTVTFSNPIAQPYMVGWWFQVTDGTDGSWYQVAAYQSTTGLTLANNYQGLTSGTSTFILGQVSQLPEEYQMALPYYAAFNFYLKRKDMAVAQFHQQQFNLLLDLYKKTYSAKATGVVQNAIQDYRYSLFSLPPNPIQ